VFDARAKPLRPGKRVDQAGFTNIRSACETDFHAVGHWHAIHRDDTFQKVGLACEKYPCRLRLLVELALRPV
jgi:hypothetical protein